MGALKNVIRGDNSGSVLGAIGEVGQKYTDPLAWALGDSYTGTLRGIADQSQSIAAQMGRPLAAIDQNLNPIRRIPIVNEVATWTESKPLDSAAIALGAMYGASALGGAMGGGAGGAGGAVGGGGSAAGGIAGSGGGGGLLSGIMGGGGGMGGWGSLIGAGASLIGSAQSASAARDAAEIQAQAAREGIAEQRRQFDASQALMRPYVQAGVGSMSQQQALLGLLGPEAQRAAIDALQNSPQMQALVSQGENSLLQNASATGGLRGGNLQAALAQFRPQMLAGLIDQQYGRLGGLSGLGQASAAGQAAQGQAMASNIGDLLQQSGAAGAGGQLAQAAINNQLMSNLAGIAGQAWGQGGGFSNLFGGQKNTGGAG